MLATLKISLRVPKIIPNGEDEECFDEIVIQT